MEKKRLQEKAVNEDRKERKGFKKGRSPGSAFS